MNTSLLKLVQARNASSYGFAFVALVVVVGFSIAAPHFASSANVFAMLHAVCPLTIASCGIGLVILTGKIDISIGSIAFLSASLGALAMDKLGWSPFIALPATIFIGAVLGLINGFVIAVLGVNSLIATLGSMIAFRGLGLLLTDARVIPLPAVASNIGNATIGPVFVDTVVVALVLVGVYTLHARTTYGRQLTAVGNNEETARRIGIPVKQTTLIAFVLSGALAGLSAVSSFIQVGSISGFLGQGLEFHAIAVAVVGGLSLAGGRGRILPGILIGALSFQVIENGLNQVSANPYIYQLVTGVVIFAAMYMDALKSSRTRRSATAV
jgi:ribose/xylose/arabinose/galactoside ABC-type transport system permease subunit